MPSGVLSRITPDSTAVTSMYPLIITQPAAITPAMPRTKYIPTSPMNITAAAGSTKRSLPTRSIALPEATLTTDAVISTTPSTSA